MNKSLLPLVLFVIVVSTGSLRSQCSDAGVCSVGHRTPQDQFRLSLEYTLGKSSKTDGLTFHSFILSGILPIFDDSRLTLGIPYNRQNGPLGSVAGIGDLTAVWTQRVASGAGYRFSVSIGAKVALADVNAEALPQAYQSGLGTNDALAGVSYETDDWNFSFGYQLSRERSDNNLSRLKRGDDLLLSAGYSTSFDAFALNCEVLGIKRIHKSSILVSTPGPLFSDIPKSDQSQINLVGRLTYPIAESASLRGSVALPLLARDINVDGLTRSFSLSLGILYTL